MYLSKANILECWNNDLNDLFNNKHSSIVTNTKKIHRLSLLDNYYIKQSQLIEGKILSDATRHFKNIKTDMPNRHIIVLLSIIFLYNIDSTNRFLNKHGFHSLDPIDIEDHIFIYMINENLKEHKYCIYFLFKALYLYSISDISIDEFLSLDQFKSYNHIYLRKHIIQYNAYTTHKHISIDKSIHYMLDIINTFINDKYVDIFDIKRERTLRNILFLNLSLGNNDILNNKILRYIKSLTDFRYIGLSKIKEKFILIGFYIGMDIEEINDMLNSVYLGGLYDDNIYHLPIIDLIKSINCINSSLLPYTVPEKYPYTLYDMKNHIKYSESLSDVLIQYKSLYKDILILGHINDLYDINH